MDLVKAVTAPLITPKPRQTTGTTAILGDGGEPLGTIKRSNTKTTLAFKSKVSKGFDDWLAQNIAEIHRDWKNRTGG